VTTAAIDIVKTTATFRYVAPFALFLVLLALAPHLPLSPLAEAELRFAILGVACAVCWPVEISVVPKAPLASILTGLGVFVLWIAPEVLVPGYRNLPLFSKVTSNCWCSIRTSRPILPRACLSERLNDAHSPHLFSS